MSDEYFQSIEENMDKMSDDDLLLSHKRIKQRIAEFGYHKEKYRRGTYAIRLRGETDYEEIAEAEELAAFKVLREKVEAELDYRQALSNLENKNSAGKNEEPPLPEKTKWLKDQGLFGYILKRLADERFVDKNSFKKHDDIYFNHFEPDDERKWTPLSRQYLKGNKQ